MISGFLFFYFLDSVSHMGTAPLRNISDPSKISKWENLQNHRVIKDLLYLTVFALSHPQSEKTNSTGDMTLFSFLFLFLLLLFF